MSDKADRRLSLWKVESASSPKLQGLRFASALRLENAVLPGSRSGLKGIVSLPQNHGQNERRCIQEHDC